MTTSTQSIIEPSTKIPTATIIPACYFVSQLSIGGKSYQQQQKKKKKNQKEAEEKKNTTRRIIFQSAKNYVPIFLNIRKVYNTYQIHPNKCIKLSV